MGITKSNSKIMINFLLKTKTHIDTNSKDSKANRIANRKASIVYKAN